MTRRINIVVFIVLLIVYAKHALAEELQHSANLRQQLKSAYLAKPETHQLRTKHICDNARPCFINRLILEQSPYLLQHAHNPIDWYPWGEQALNKAREENKPVFLSIGYAACHWCHVMEKESFDNLRIARIINKNFVAIKVDRERREDIDEFYASAVMYFQGQQGWPMSLFIMPDGKPFYGGGYYSADEFEVLLDKISAEWDAEYSDIKRTAEKVTNELKNTAKEISSYQVVNDVLRMRAIKDLLSISDSERGGFGESEKFPREPWLYLLLNEVLVNQSAKRREEGVADKVNARLIKKEALKALQTSLSNMARGGIFDQLAGGFHRYSVDPYWKVPHFEKMLYNQALLIPLYLQVNRVKTNVFFERVAKQTADFIIEEMQDPRGGFYASIDADSDNKEGFYYVWDVAELEEYLNQSQQEFVAGFYDVDEYGETDDNLNVLYMPEALDEYAEATGQEPREVIKKLDSIRANLLKIRNKRKPPEKDHKIIMGWNGLAIAALADASMYLDDKQYMEASLQAAEFVWNNMRVDQEFYRVFYRGELSQQAVLSDYAYYIQALIKLYDLNQGKRWLKRAMILTEFMFEKFWDDRRGGFFNTIEYKGAALPVRAKSAFDKTLFSANGIATQILIRLYYRSGEEKYLQHARVALSAFSADVKEVPSAHSGLLIAADKMRYGETGLPVFAARGHVRIDAVVEAEKSKGKENKVFDFEDSKIELKVELKIDEGWHINSVRPLEKSLVATSVDVVDSPGWNMRDMQYPEGELVKLGYAERKLSLYQGDIYIKSALSKKKDAMNPVVNIRLQACNNKICLPPEDVLIMPRLKQVN